MLLSFQRAIFEPRNIQLLKIRKSKWWDNAYGERIHCTDDEEFYIPKFLSLQSQQDYFQVAWGDVWHFNMLRRQQGEHMQNRTPFQTLRAFCPNLPDFFCSFPPTLLVPVGCEKTFLKTQSVHDVLAHLHGGLDNHI